MNETEIRTMKSRSIFSVLSLLFQSSFAAVLGFGAFFILTLRSSEAILGIYGTVLASLSFFNYITNLGLAAALIQKKEVKQIDLNTAFYLQMFLVGVAVILGFTFDNQLLANYKDLPTDTLYLYWVLLGSFFLLSLKTIPSVLLEKSVEIYKNVLVQVVENTVFYLAIIFMVFFGYEIEALIVAVALRGVIGTGLMYLLKPWLPGLSFSVSSAKELLSFGLPFQGNSFLAMIKDDLLIIYLGQTIGLTNLGIVTFGKKYAEVAVRIITDNFNRVAFPVFSNVQENKDLLKKSLHNVIFFSSMIVFPVIIGGIFTFDSFLRVIDGYFDKWNDSLFSFYFFSLSTLFVSLMTPFINLFNAVKKVKVSLFFMAIWTALTWILIPPAISVFNYNAISIVFLIVNMTFIFVVIKAKDIVQFSLWDTLRGVVLSSLFMTFYLVLIRLISINFLQTPEVHLIFSLIGAPIVYISTVIGMYGIDTFKKIATSMGKPSAILQKEDRNHDH